MRVIKSDTGFLAYQKIFKRIHSDNSVIVLWQLLPETNQRNVFESNLISFHPESGLLYFNRSSDAQINQNLSVFCYSEDGQFIFKSTLHEVRSQALVLRYPVEMRLLEEPDLTIIESNSGVNISTIWKSKKFSYQDISGPDFMVVKSMAQRSARDQEFLASELGNGVTLDEEDKIYAEKRESPRARPKLEKFVKIKSPATEEVHVLRLFDLSQGGIGFLTMEPLLFPKESEIRVVGFKEFDLDDPLIAKVMSQRAVDDTQIDYKIGCKFVEGQN